MNSEKFQAEQGATEIEIPAEAHVQGGIELPTRERHEGYTETTGGAPKSPDPMEKARTRILSRECLNSFWVRQRAPVEQVLSFLQKSYKVNVAMVTMIGSNQQFHVCELGLGVSAIPRCQSFCAWTVQNKYVKRHKRGTPTIFDGCEMADDPDAPLMLVSDALKHEAFNDNPLVLGYPNIRLYAGVPLVVKDSENSNNLCVGALCLLHDQARATFCPQLLIEAATCIMRMMRPTTDLYRLAPPDDAAVDGGDKPRRRKTIAQLRALGHFNIVLSRIIAGQDKRCCVMLTGIPNRFTSHRIQLHFLEIGVPPYDYFFLPSGIRSSNRGNCFINFRSPRAVYDFCKLVENKTWPNYVGVKTLGVAYSHLQGLQQLRVRLGESISILNSELQPVVTKQMLFKHDVHKYQPPRTGNSPPVMCRMESHSSYLCIPRLCDVADEPEPTDNRRPQKQGQQHQQQHHGQQQQHHQQQHGQQQQQFHNPDRYQRGHQPPPPPGPPPQGHGVHHAQQQYRGQRNASQNSHASSAHGQWIQDVYSSQPRRQNSVHSHSSMMSAGGGRGRGYQQHQHQYDQGVSDYGSDGELLTPRGLVGASPAGNSGRNFYEPPLTMGYNQHRGRSHGPPPGAINLERQFSSDHSRDAASRGNDYYGSQQHVTPQAVGAPGLSSQPHARRVPGNSAHTGYTGRPEAHPFSSDPRGYADMPHVDAGYNNHWQPSKTQTNAEAMSAAHAHTREEMALAAVARARAGLEAAEVFFFTFIFFFKVISKFYT